MYIDVFIGSLLKVVPCLLALPVEMIFKSHKSHKMSQIKYLCVIPLSNINMWCLIVTTVMLQMLCCSFQHCTTCRTSIFLVLSVVPQHLVNPQPLSKHNNSIFTLFHVSPQYQLRFVQFLQVTGCAGFAICPYMLKTGLRTSRMLKKMKEFNQPATLHAVLPGFVHNKNHKQYV